MHYILTLFINLFFVSAHPFHVSVCDIYFNADTKSAEITHKIFLDDLENALKKSSDYPVDILKMHPGKELDKILVRYLKSNFSCVIDGKNISLTYIGSEIQADALWVYQEAANVQEFSKVNVRNTILFELFDDQTNLVHIKKGKKIKSMRLYDDSKRGEVNFK